MKITNNCVNRILLMREKRKLPIQQIASQLGVPSSIVKIVCDYRLYIEDLEKLSIRAKKGVILIGPKSKSELADKVLKGLDIESVPGIGHKTAQEILNWCGILASK